MIDIAIERRERTNDKGETYSQYFRDGVIVGCGCKQAEAITIEKYGSAPCKHLKDANATQAIVGEDLAAHVNDEPLRGYEGCDYCGRNHKWWNCPF